jgi:hypothetical protein
MNNMGAVEGVVTDEMIMNHIYVLRGHKVMIDADLASLYQMETRRLRALAEKHAHRFPNDFMFRLRLEDYQLLKQQDPDTRRKDALKTLPVAFTEQGLAMLAGLLKTEHSISVNVRIIRIFTLIRQLLPDYPELSRMIEQFKVGLVRP